MKQRKRRNLWKRKKQRKNAKKNEKEKERKKERKNKEWKSSERIERISIPLLSVSERLLFEK